jgi:outer membrane protein
MARVFSYICHQIYKNRIMKKIGIVVVIALTLTSCTQTKIGYVDLEEVVKEYKGTKDAEKAMNEKSAGIKGQLDQLAAEYQTKVTDYYAKVKTMSTKVRQQTEDVLRQQQEVLNQRQQQAQAEVQKDGQERMGEINENIIDFVSDYAKVNGFTYILGTSEQTKTVLYGDSKTDLTDVILENLNDAYKKENKVEVKEGEAEK